MPPLPSTNFEIQKYYQCESRFKGVYSGDNLPEHSFTETKDEIYNKSWWVLLYRNSMSFFVRTT